ncbi:MAG: HAD family hydrolase [Clostridia bacterium]|nr:HAD family hydrolase [Clostridia bacterium]
MKNFVFDIYGTLVDIKTDEQSSRFKRRFSAYFNKHNKNGVDFFAEYFSRCAQKDNGGDSELDLFAVFKEICGESEATEIAQKFRSLSRSRLKVYRGIKKLLKTLKGGGAKLYILSNAQTCFTLPELEKLKLMKYFDGVEISSEFGKKKPSKEFFEHVVNKYSLEKSETVYIGNDFVCDILGAKSAGLKAVYISSNLSPETDELAKISEVADFVTDKVSELKNYLI